MLGKLFSRDPIEGFWKWFVENSKRLEEVKTGQEPVIRQCGNKLKAINPDLVMQFSKSGSGSYEFEVSADGNRQIFHVVKDVVAKAPQVQGWTIVPFRQPIDEPPTVEINGLTISPEQVYYTSRRNAFDFEVYAYIENFSEEQRDAYIQAAFILMDATVGEYDFEMKIAGVRFEALSSYTGSEPLKPLKQLRQELATI